MALLSRPFVLVGLLLAGCSTFDDTAVDPVAAGAAGASVAAGRAGAAGSVAGGSGTSGQSGSSQGGAGQVGGGSGQGGAGPAGAGGAAGGGAGAAGGAGVSGSSGQGGNVAGGQGPGGEAGGGAGGSGGAATGCGNGKREGTEACDGPELGGATCGSKVGFSSTGTLTCKADCSFDVTGCTTPPGCGNGVIDNGEECDGTVFGTATCESKVKAPSAGSLTCTEKCTIDTSTCQWCGNGVTDSGEACDDANQDSTDGCSVECKLPACGDGFVQLGEECDPKKTPSCTTECKKTCSGSGSFKVGSSCYVLLTEAVTWSQAKAKCEALTGGQYRLSSIETKAEFDQLELQLTSPLIDVWLGGQRVSGTLTWLTGPVISFPPGKSPWDVDEPSSGGDCVFAHGTSLKAVLRADVCNETYESFCEW